MTCAWKELLAVLPRWMQQDIDILGRETLQELRLRCNAPPELILCVGRKRLSRKVTGDDINYCINAASRYSPWAAATVSKGYITAPGGHRIGLCGEAVYRSGRVEGMKNVSSLCIRVSRDFPGIAKSAPIDCSLLILGAPGWGKTTLLRDLIRSRSENGIQVAVVDERGELFPTDTFPTGGCTDVLKGCHKSDGMHMLLRTMGPACIAVDEITQAEDCTALAQAAGCGVTLLATAHATNMDDLKRRSIYCSLLESGIFDGIITLRSDKSWRLERMKNGT